MAGSAGMAGAAAESGLRFATYHVETGRAWRNRTTRQSTLAQRETARRRKNLMNRSRRKTLQLDRRAVARALDCDHGFSRADRIDLRLSHASSFITWAISRRRSRTSWPVCAAQNEVASVQIAALTSRVALQRRLKEGYLKMIPISEQNIVRLSAPARSAEEDAIQPVVNKRARQMKWNSRTRCALVCLAFIALFSLFSFRLVYLQTAQARRVRRTRSGKTRLQANDLRRTRRRSSTPTTKCSRTTCRSKRSWPMRRI